MSEVRRRFSVSPTDAQVPRRPCYSLENVSLLNWTWRSRSLLTAGLGRRSMMARLSHIRAFHVGLSVTRLQWHQMTMTHLENASRTRHATSGLMQSRDQIRTTLPGLEAAFIYARDEIRWCVEELCFYCDTLFCCNLFVGIGGHQLKTGIE